MTRFIWTKYTNIKTWAFPFLSTADFAVSFSLAFSYVTSRPLWPPLLYLLSLSLDWYWLLSGSLWLRPAVTLCPLMIRHEVAECLPFLNYHTQDTAVTRDLLIHYPCTIGDREIVRIYSASPVSDKFHLLSAPALIFRSWKWTTGGLIVFWINRAASLSDAPLLSFSTVSPRLSHTQIHTHIYQQLAHVKLHVSVNQINLWQRRTEPVMGCCSKAWLYCTTAVDVEPLTKAAPFWMKLFSFFCWFCCRLCLKG